MKDRRITIAAVIRRNEELAAELGRTKAELAKALEAEKEARTSAACYSSQLAEARQQAASDRNDANLWKRDKTREHDRGNAWRGIAERIVESARKVQALAKDAASEMFGEGLETGKDTSVDMAYYRGKVAAAKEIEKAHAQEIARRIEADHAW